MTIDELLKSRQQADLLFNGEDIISALKKQAEEINSYLDSLDKSDLPPLVLPVMNGGLIYAGHLLPMIKTPVQVDYIHATRYRNTTQGFELQWKVYPQHDLKGRLVILLDDIFDEGHTLKAVVEYCLSQQAKEVLTSVLVTKDHDRRDDALSVNFSALTVPDRYVFGFGMDYQGQLRNLNGIYAI